MKRGWNIVILAIAALVVTCALTGCSNSPKDEKGIIEDLKASNQFISDTAEIESCEIIKRQTNTENGTDEVYVTVEGGNDELSFTLSYILTYELYNEGWFLEGIAPYPDGPCDIQGLSEEQLKKDVINNDRFLASHKDDSLNFSIEDFTINVENYYFDSTPYETSYIKTYDLTVVAYNLAMRYTTTCTIEYIIVDDQWICRYYNTNNAFHVPDFSPSGDSILELLDEKGYTRYELDHIDTDWDNCKETQYYKAYRDYELGTEEYEIIVPLAFTLDGEDYSYGWHFSSNEIEENLISVDWTLQGTWSAEGGEYWADNYRYEYNLLLEIGEMLDGFIPNDEREQGFCFYLISDSTYINDFYGEKIYSCVTSTEGQGVVILGTKPGIYKVTVEDRTSKWEDRYEIYMGVYDDDEYKCGVYWTGGGDIVQLTKEE